MSDEWGGGALGWNVGALARGGRVRAPARRIAALYDIHGNLPALEAVLAEVRGEGIDGVLVGGDVVPGPMPRQTLALLLDLDLPVRFISGNGEREVLEVRDGVEPEGLPPPAVEALRWVAGELGEEEAEALRSWPATARWEVEGGGKVLFCHATPGSDREIFTRRTPERALLPEFADAGVDLVVCGHTHMQFDRRVGSVRVVNAGSVGMPFGDPGAYWLALGPDVELRRTEYDLEAAAERIRRTAYPNARGFAADEILRPKAEEDVLRMFERAAVKPEDPGGSAS